MLVLCLGGHGSSPVASANRVCHTSRKDQFASVERRTNTTDMAYVNSEFWESLHSDQKGCFRAVGYPEMGEGFNKATYQMRLDALERLLKRQRLWPLRDILEGAVGIGAYGPLWQKAQVERWTGLDISSSAIEHVSKIYPSQQFRVVDLSNQAGMNAALDDRRFSLASAIDVLYHIVEDDSFENALRNLASRVNQQGYLVVSDIFPSQDTLSKRHVKRRSMQTYERVLHPLGFELVSREPVFSILGEGLPRGPHHLSDVAMSVIWRVTSKVVRLTPLGLRDAMGFVVVKGLKPFDALLQSSGISSGTNLELALFRRTGTALAQN